MASPEHLKILKQGVEVWNKWRRNNIDIIPDLSDLDLFGGNFEGANLSGANLKETGLSMSNLSETDLSQAELCNASLWGAALDRADLSGADLSGAKLGGVRLYGSNLSGINLTGADLRETDLFKMDLSGLNLSKATLIQANLSYACLKDTNLKKANLAGANLLKADLSGADLTGANLITTVIVDANCEKAIFNGCRVYGIAAWDIHLSPDNQLDLIITPPDQPSVTVDNLEVAQFIYLLLNQKKIRDVIDTMGKKGVLIIGRFTEKRKAILHAVRDELRSRYDLLPIMFEFDPLSTEPTIKTLSTLAHLSRFVIADLTDAKSVLQELTTILEGLPTLPVKPLIHESDDLPPMGDSFLIMKSMLEPYVYSSKDKLLLDLKAEVINPAEDCIKKFEAELEEIRSKWFSWQKRQ